MKIAVVTGVSKGLGKSIAQLFMGTGVHVIGISRTINKQLEEYAKEMQVNYLPVTCDLQELNSIEEMLPHITEKLNESDYTTIYVVNNAATLDPIDQAKNINHKDLVNHVHVNTVAPMIILNHLLHSTTETNANIIACNITSGAAERPIYGWSAYCSTKASINMYTKTVALEQEEQKTGHKIIAFSPGIMDTNMQEKIRSSSPEAFIDVETFRAYQKNNQLKNPHEVAQVVVDIMTDEENIENGKIYHVTDYI